MRIRARVIACSMGSAALLLAGCNFGPRVRPVNPIVDPNRPQWTYEEGGRHGGYVWAVGSSAQKMTETEARETARADAYAKLALQISPEVSRVVADRLGTQGAPNSQSSGASTKPGPEARSQATATLAAATDLLSGISGLQGSPYTREVEVDPQTFPWPGAEDPKNIRWDAWVGVQIEQEYFDTIVSNYRSRVYEEADARKDRGWRDAQYREAMRLRSSGRPEDLTAASRILSELHGLEPLNDGIAFEYGRVLWDEGKVHDAKSVLEALAASGDRVYRAKAEAYLRSKIDDTQGMLRGRQVDIQRPSDESLIGLYEGLRKKVVKEGGLLSGAGDKVVITELRLGAPEVMKGPEGESVGLKCTAAYKCTVSSGGHERLIEGVVQSHGTSDSALRRSLAAKAVTSIIEQLKPH